MFLASAPARSRPDPSRPSRALGVASCILACCWLGACRPAPDEDPRLRERVVSARSRALVPLLERVGSLDGTRLGGLSRRLLERTAECEELVAIGPAAQPAPDREATSEAISPAPLGPLARLECADEAPASDSLAAFARARRGDADGLVLWPLAGDGRLEIRVQIDERGGLELAGQIVPPSEAGGWSLLVPGRTAAAEPVMAARPTLVHARVRPADGLRLAEQFERGSQADRLFALRSRLLEGALLAGTWEFALTEPLPGSTLPLAVLALHHRVEGGIREAASEIATRLETIWPIARSPRAFGLADGSAARGACFLDLPLLPELAPCWLVTPDALLIGYRAEAIEAVLAAPAVSADGELDASPGDAQLVVQLDRFRRVDAEQVASDDATAVEAHPGDLFSQLTLHWHSDGVGRIALRGRLEATP